ncbi:hypothetical protein [Prescottella equi]|nr:hypothetical protein [Prescottella equi]
MKRTIATIALSATAALVLGGCSSSDSKSTEEAAITSAVSISTTTTTTTAGAGVRKPSEEATSETYGIATKITDVSAVDTAYGPAVVVTIDLRNDSDKTFEDYNWPTPQLSHGPRGLPAERIVSFSDKLGDGVNGNIPPGGSRVVREGYKVSMDDMRDATLSVGSIIWRGDFTVPLTNSAATESPMSSNPSAAAASPSAAARDFGSMLDEGARNQVAERPDEAEAFAKRASSIVGETATTTEAQMLANLVCMSFEAGDTAEETAQSLANDMGAPVGKMRELVSAATEYRCPGKG